jgi:hypothetical protein
MFSACASAQGADSFHSLYLHILEHGGYRNDESVRRNRRTLICRIRLRLVIPALVDRSPPRIWPGRRG